MPKAGFLEGYDQLEGSELGLRVFSIATSLVTLPMGTSDFALWMMSAEGQNQNQNQHFVDATLANNKMGLRFYHLTEVLNLMNLMVFQFLYRPWGLAPILAFYVLGSAVIFRDSMSFISFLVVPVLFFFNAISPGATFPAKNIRNMVRVRLFLSIATSVANIVGIYRSPAQLAQMLSLKVLPITILGLSGSVLHVGSTIQQWRAGRWRSSGEMGDNTYEALGGASW